MNTTMDHRAGVDLLFFLQPGVRDAQHLVASGRGRGRATLRQVAPGTPPGRPAGRLAGCGLDRPGTPRPGECSSGSSRWCCRSGSRLASVARRSGAGSVRCPGSWPDRSAAASWPRDGAVSVMRPVETARETEPTSVSAGQCLCGAPAIWN
jgi:hypothetical protein